MWRGVLIVAVAAGVLLALAGCAGTATDASDLPEGWSDEATWLLAVDRGGDIDSADFAQGVDHPYFPLVPGTRWVYETTDGVERIEIEVLAETRQVMGVECTVVRDTVYEDGEMIEDTFDWYAQDMEGNVWYMGEDVDNYVNGRLDNHDGAWEAGVNGALPGIKMWAEPQVGSAPYYQEYYEGEAEDLGLDIAVDATTEVPFGTFSGLVVVEEWNPLEPSVVERKYYASGVGVVRETTVRGGSEVVELVEFETP